MIITIDNVEVVGVGFVEDGGTINVTPGSTITFQTTVHTDYEYGIDLDHHLYKGAICGQQPCSGDGKEEEAQHIFLPDTTPVLTNFLTGWTITEEITFCFFLALNVCGYPFGYIDKYTFIVIPAAIALKTLKARPRLRLIEDKSRKEIRKM